MSWKVLVTARPLSIPAIGSRSQELLRAAGCEVVFPPKFGPLTEAEIQPLLEGMDAVFASVDKYTAAVLASPAAARLKLIARWGVGYDAIDVPAATQCGIVVTYTPGLLNEAVADFSMALLLALARRVHEGHLAMRQGAPWLPVWGDDVAGKTLGIIGCGRIGQAVARRAAGFNMPLLGYDVTPNPEAEKLGVRFVGLDELLASSDYISLHAALTPESRGLIGEAQLRRMKSTAYLINAARGAMLDETVLVRALTEKWIAGAALDAFAVEPLPVDHPLRSCPNLLLTPHQASLGADTGRRVTEVGVQSIIDLLQGRPPKLMVNPEVLKSPALRTSLR